MLQILLSMDESEQFFFNVMDQQPLAVTSHGRVDGGIEHVIVFERTYLSILLSLQVAGKKYSIRSWYDPRNERVRM